MINTRSSAAHSTAHKLHPLSLLAQLISRQVSGCLRLTASYPEWNSAERQPAQWRLLLERGQLNFATNSVNSFDRLIRHLQAAATGVPSSICEQMRLLFEEGDQVADVISRDYRALCWLVEQKYLSDEQAGQIVGAIALEVIEPFLNIREGSYELISRTQIESIPTYCRLDLRPIVEICQRNSKQRAAGQAVTSRLPNAMTAVSDTANPPSPTQAPARLGNSQNGQGQTKQFLADKATGSSSIHQANLESLRQTTYTVACIDDSPTVLNAIQKFLEDQSLSVVAINDPVKALMQIVRSKPDLILLDITMPNLDGYELCALLRRHPRYKRTPIVMVTGNTGLIDRARAKLVRASGYLTKPFTQSDLLKMVFKHLPTTR
ncbi:response regulator [cf. Phormidesmis sp. LEGE 11477]|uniref:response regulator n=1 Tax=cf. Phormidesmis sp. LEGE 11477 TaxID=1828680 RepID=UPI00188091D4|nr:response regulator [cf. Phormidesmis sp. LEGE 11477]MBE9063773.1 response regulator [cf. Phormidesmis sp. LEGE 11477]